MKDLEHHLSLLYDRAADIEEDFIWRLLEQLVDFVSEDLDPSVYLEVKWCILEKDVLWYLDLSQRITQRLTALESPAQFIAHAGIAALLKKYPFKGVNGLDPEASALENAYKAERLCRITNKRLRYYRYRWYRLKNKQSVFGQIFHSARLQIQRILGPLNLERCADGFRHGPGGALGRKNPEVTAYFKYAGDGYSVSTLAKPYAEAAILLDRRWTKHLLMNSGLDVDPMSFNVLPTHCREVVAKTLVVADYNKVTFVPKTAKTHRAIAVEPLMNVYLQLGLGAYIRDKLRTHGIDLDDNSFNQHLAEMGSRLDTEYIDAPATLDVEMASDTLSFELVRELLPPDWFECLNRLRSHHGLLNGDVLKWEKFSSMGNGFTFELESLIFYALACSVVRHLNADERMVSVFGDDIVVPGSAAELLSEVLRFAGFRLNTAKSFVNGPFRESCGKDFFKGVELRPIFLDEEVKQNGDLVFLSNSLSILVQKYLDCIEGEHPDPSGVERFIRAHIPYGLRTYLVGPPNEDRRGHLWTNFDVAMTLKGPRWERGLWSWSYLSASAKPVVRRAKRWYVAYMVYMLRAEADRGDPLPVYLQETMAGGLPADRWVTLRAKGRSRIARHNALHW